MMGSQPARKSTELFPEHHEQQSQCGVIDHVSSESSVDYAFLWTPIPKMCEICGRRVHIQVIILGYKHRFCRKDMSPDMKDAFHEWLYSEEHGLW